MSVYIYIYYRPRETASMNIHSNKLDTLLFNIVLIVDSVNDLRKKNIIICKYKVIYYKYTYIVNEQDST